MDNKKLYKRISTCFWFMLATLPFWYSTLTSLLFWFAHVDGLSTLSDINDFFARNFASYFISTTNSLNQFNPTFLRTPFEDLLRLFNIGNYSVFAGALSWFCWVYFIELMVDFVVWLPKLCHSFMERWLAD